MPGIYTAYSTRKIYQFIALRIGNYCSFGILSGGGIKYAYPIGYYFAPPGH
jgi:hypothetical protein